MQVCERFVSFSGEAPFPGELVYFIRLAKCNMVPHCSYCDSSYSFKNGREESWKNIVKYINSQKVEKVIWTGGEPSLQIEEIYKVIKCTPDITHQIETNGLIKFNPKLFKAIVISPKPQRFKKELLDWFSNFTNVYFKFVVKNKEEFKFWDDFIQDTDLKYNDNIYFMPQGVTDIELKSRASWLRDLCIKYRYGLSPRFHIWLFGNKRGT